MNEPKLVECSFLVPVTDSRHRRMIPHVQDSLLNFFGGYSISEGLIQGAWKNHLGNVIHDTLRHFTIALPEKEIDKLRGILRIVCRQFGQDCVYFSVRGEVEFVSPSKVDPLKELHDNAAEILSKMD